MSLCRHTGWLRLWHDAGQTTLEASDRPRRLLQNIARADDPVAFALLIGNKTKGLLLSELCAGLRLPNGLRHHGEVHLHLSQASTTQPVVVAESDIPAHNRLPRSSRSHRCHETSSAPFSNGPPHSSVEAADDVHHRLLLPLVDIVCLFVADIGGIDNAIQRLRAWSDRGSPSTSPIRPALLLVVARGETSRMRAAVSSASRHGSPLDSYFHSVTVVAFRPASNGLRVRKQVRSLRRRLLQLTELVHRDRHRTGYLFSARHTVAYLWETVLAATQSPWCPFDFIKASRRLLPVVPDLCAHLANLFKQVGDNAAQQQPAAAIAASSFLLDHYRPMMHRKQGRRVSETQG
jgi:hypothetical protein